jgi:hypothetical protein
MEALGHLLGREQMAQLNREPFDPLAGLNALDRSLREIDRALAAAVPELAYDPQEPAFDPRDLVETQMAEFGNTPSYREGAPFGPYQIGMMIAESLREDMNALSALSAREAARQAAYFDSHRESVESTDETAARDDEATAYNVAALASENYDPLDMAYGAVAISPETFGLPGAAMPSYSSYDDFAAANPVVSIGEDQSTQSEKSGTFGGSPLGAAVAAAAAAGALAADPSPNSSNDSDTSDSSADPGGDSGSDPGGSDSSGSDFSGGEGTDSFGGQSDSSDFGSDFGSSPDVGTSFGDLGGVGWNKGGRVVKPKRKALLEKRNGRKPSSARGRP